MNRFSFSSDNRLKKTSQFQFVYTHCRKIETDSMRVYVARSTGNTKKVGVVASKKIGNSVVRHRCKRVLREIFRLAQHHIQDGLDMVLVAKPRLCVVPFYESQAGFQRLLSREGWWR